MTTVAEIIQDAYRESNLLSINAVPTAAEQAEALRLLNRIRLSVYGNEAGENLQPFPIGSANVEAPSGFPWNTAELSGDWFLPLNHRIYANLTNPQTIALHPVPQDGSMAGVIDVAGNFATYPLTIEGNGRLIDGATSVTLNTNGFVGKYFYKADIGEWVTVPVETQLTDVWPFPVEFDDMFVIMLALRLNPRHGTTMSPESQFAFKRSKSQFQARYTQRIAQPSELGLIRLTGAQRRQWSEAFWDPTTAFSVGGFGGFGGFGTW